MYLIKVILSPYLSPGMRSVINTCALHFRQVVDQCCGISNCRHSPTSMKPRFANSEQYNRVVIGNNYVHIVHVVGYLLQQVFDAGAVMSLIYFFLYRSIFHESDAVPAFHITACRVPDCAAKHPSSVRWAVWAVQLEIAGCRLSIQPLNIIRYCVSTNSA